MARNSKRKRGSGGIKSESKDVAGIKEEDGNSLIMEHPSGMADTKPLSTDMKSITPKTDLHLDEEENTPRPNVIEIITTENERKRQREVQLSRARDKLDREDEKWGPAVELYLESLLESMTPVESLQPQYRTALNGRNFNSHLSDIKVEDIKGSGSEEEEREPKRQRLDSAGTFQGQHQGPTVNNSQPYRKLLKYESEEKVKLTTDQKNRSGTKHRRRRQPAEYINLKL